MTKLTVNGVAHDVAADDDMPLLWGLRDLLGLVGAAVTVGTWLTHALFLAYRQRLAARADENTGEGELEYWLSRRVVIEGTVGNHGYNGVDLLWRKRY